jgi:phosphoglycolate phosphatase-like HAD superfamily hydrolase
MKLAIFDVDGTLTQTNDVDSVCFVQALADAHEMTGISTNWEEYPHTTDSGIILQIFQERLRRAPATEELLTLQHRFVGLLKDQHAADSALFMEIAGASQALKRLRSEPSWAIAIATGCWRASADMKLEAAGIEADDLPFASAEDAISREEIVSAALSKALVQYRQTRFERIVSIGDALWDVRTAMRLNIAFLGINSGHDATRLRRAGASHVIEDFRDYERSRQYLDSARVPVT